MTDYCKRLAHEDLEIQTQKTHETPPEATNKYLLFETVCTLYIRRRL